MKGIFKEAAMLGAGLGFGIALGFLIIAAPKVFGHAPGSSAEGRDWIVIALLSAVNLAIYALTVVVKTGVNDLKNAVLGAKQDR